MEGSDTPPPEEPAREEPAPEASTPITPMRRPMRKRNEPVPEPSADSHIAGVIAFLSSLYSQSKTSDDAGPAPERTQSVLQAKRLSRSGGGAVGEAGAATAVGTGIQLEPGTPGGGTALGKMKPRVARSRRARAWNPALVWSVAVGVALLGLAAAWAWPGGRSSAAAAAASPGVSAPAPSRPPGNAQVSDEALQIADQVLTAISKGDHAGALDLLEAADRRKLLVPGLRYQAGLLAYHQRDSYKAAHWINASIEAGEFLPECAYLQAAEAASRNNYAAAAARLREAARLTPFNPRYYFHWAECLRRAGKPAEAIERFEQARRCRPTSGDLELILFKLDLARIEAGNDAEFQADVAQKLTVEPVSGNLLLLGAATEICHDNYAAATPYLQRAAQVLSPTLMRTRMRDYLFRLPVTEKDLAAEWAALIPAPATAAPAGPATPPPLVDPATRGLVDTDPAVW